MEKTDFPRLLIAAAPDQAGKISFPGAVIAHMTYRVENGPKLYRSVAADQIRGGVLMADDLHLSQIGSSNFFCRQAVRECRARGAEGFLANWCGKASPEMVRLTADLALALESAGLSLWVPEAYAKCAPKAYVMISSAISGGTLKARIMEAMNAYGSERVTLCVERMSEDFVMPAPTGSGSPLTPAALNDLMKRVHPSVYYSAELCAHYFTYANGGKVHFVLFDNQGSIRKKLFLAKQLGVKQAVVVWEEFSDRT